MAADSQSLSTAPQPAATTAGTLVQRLRQELAQSERAHVDRLQAYQERLATLARLPRRRGRAWQQQRRELERGLRQEAVAFCRQVATRGRSLAKAALALNLAPRTLRYWARQTRAGKLAAAPLGRPAAPTEPAQRDRVLQFLAEKGPGVGVPTLQGALPRPGPRRTERPVPGVSPPPAPADAAALLPAALAVPGQRLGHRLRRAVLAWRCLVPAADRRRLPLPAGGA